MKILGIESSCDETAAAVVRVTVGINNGFYRFGGIGRNFCFQCLRSDIAV